MNASLTEEIDITVKKADARNAGDSDSHVRGATDSDTSSRKTGESSSRVRSRASRKKEEQEAAQRESFLLAAQVVKQARWVYEHTIADVQIYSHSTGYRAPYAAILPSIPGK